MLSIEGGLGFLNFDQIKFTKTLDRTLGQIMREGARNWLRAVITSVPSRGGFPVLTGAAKSTLAPLGRLLRVSVVVVPVPDKRGRLIDHRSLGEASQEFALTSAGFIYTFSWSTDLLHYILNEDDPGTPTVASSPWHSTDAGNEALEAFIGEAIQRRLPKLADYITFTIGRA